MAKSRGSRIEGSSIRYLRCRVAPGMFRGEFLITLKGRRLESPDQSVNVQMLVDGQEVSGVHGEPKRNQPAPGWVKVTFAGEQKGFIKVILPQPAQPVGESMFVTADELKEQPGV